MKTLIGFLLLLCLAIYAGLNIHADPGYILIGFQHWTVEMPLWLGIITLSLTGIMLHLAFRLFSYLIKIDDHFKQWKKQKRTFRAHQQTNQGLIALIEGDWKTSETLLLNAARYSDTPLINYLSAARAAHSLSAYDRRDQHLKCAHESTKGAGIAVGLTQAELQLKRKQLEQALATLCHLSQIAPKQTHVLLLLLKTYEQLGDWQQVLSLLTRCQKSKAISADDFQAYQQKAYTQLLHHTGRLDAAEQLWHTMPKALHTEPTILTLYVNILLNYNRGDEVVVLLREALKKDWHPDWITLFAEAKVSHTKQQITMAEQWLAQHPDDPLLLRALGKLCLREKLWGKSQHYLEASLTFSPQASAYRLLGELFDALDQPEKALEAYRQAATA